VMDSDIRELLQRAKELRAASEQLMAQTQLLKAQTARLIEKSKGTTQALIVVFKQTES